MPANAYKAEQEPNDPYTPSLRDALLFISDRCAALPDLDTRSPEEILGYDEHGLPG